jgi:glycine/D-amino acid oxidase-like deaminating enzyme
MRDGRSISLWMDQLAEPLNQRPSLSGSLEADVAIIGAGYTGLWTAYYLKQQDPGLRIVIVEAEIAGFGASGRNGGWLMGNILGEDQLLGGLSDEGRQAGYDLLHGIPDEVGRVIRREGIDCDFRKGGVLYCAARYAEQLPRLQAQLQSLRHEGLGEEDYRWLDAAELSRQVRMQGAYGGLFSPHCATIHPAKLVRGLAACVERLGVQIFEGSPVTQWQSGRVTTAKGEVRAKWVVPAIEGYAGSLPPLDRHHLAVQSLLVATEPLSEELWADIGLEQGQAFSENSRQVTYGQRTLDNRLVFGARGGYRFGGRLRTDFNLTEEERGLRRYLFSALFPQLADVRITHAWGGNLGMARRFQPHMLRDPLNRVVLAGGYGGEGVGATNLAGRTLADLILGRDSSLLEQPWVQREGRIDRLPRWEPEPLRWLGYNAIMRSFAQEDRVLADPNSASWQRKWVQWWANRMESLMR